MVSVDYVVADVGGFSTGWLFFRFRFSFYFGSGGLRYCDGADSDLFQLSWCGG